MASEFEEIFKAENMVQPTNMRIVEPPKTEPPKSDPPADPPKSDPPAAETKPTEIPEPVKAYFKEKFGTENVEEVETGYKSLSELKTKAAEAETLRVEKQNLETQNKQLSEKPTYKSDFAKKADEIYELTKGKVSAETIARFYDLDPTKLTAEQRLDLLEQIENPESTPEDRALIRNEKYSTSDDLGLTDGQKALRRNQLQKDSANASERLLQLKAEAFKPVVDNQPDPKVIQAETDRQAFWQGNTDKIDASVFKLEVPMKGKNPNGKGGVDEVDVNFNFELPKETKEKVLLGVAQQLSNPANAKYFTPDTEGIKRANDYVRQQVRDVMFSEAIKAMATHNAKRESDIHETYSKLLNNTDFLNHRQPDAGGQKGVVDYNANAEKYLAAH